MSRLHTRTLSPQRLPESQIDTLFALYARYYAGTSAALFRRDLLEKDHILLLQDETDTVRGFSTLKIISFVHRNAPARAVFSGDTIIDHAFWGEQTLPLAWCRLVGRIKAQQPEAPLFWLLIVKGDRTYRYLSVFSKSHYPNRRYPTPPDTQAIMHQLASARFGYHYDPASGLVRYPQSQGHLKSEWHNNPASGKPEAQFFARCNPRHATGDELVCLTRLEADNLRSFALRGFLQGLADGALET